jgi:hypothetical protein
VTDDALRDAVLDRLDTVDLVAAEGDPRTLLPTVRDDLYRLAEGFRVLLDEHRPDDDGRCRGCPAGWRGRRWPCSVWASAHRKLIGHSPARPKPSSPVDGSTADQWFSPRWPEGSEMPDPPGETVEGHPGNADTEEFARPDLLAPPLGGYLETDYTRIHRAPVVDRSIHGS